MSLSRMLARLAEVCRERPLTEKWLLAPNLRIGRQWIQQVAFSGVSVVNLRVQTIRGMAAELAGPEMVRRRSAPLTAMHRQFLIDRLLADAHQRLEYLSRTPVTPRLSQTVLRAIESIRLEGLDVRKLALDCFESPAKGRDLAKLSAAFHGELTKRNLLDDADVLRWAAGRLREDPSPPAADLRLLVPADLDFSKLERELIDAFPPDQVLTLPVDEPIDRKTAADAEPPTCDRRLLAWRPAVDLAPAPLRDGTTAIYHAVGERNEVREALRRLLADGTPFDQAEIVYTDGEVYVPALYETLAALADDDAGAEIPITFSEGLPCRYSRPGRALTAWMRWMSEEHPPSLLAEMIRDGLFEIPPRDGEPIDADKLSAELRAAKIGLSRERYLSKLELEKSAAQRRLSEVGDDDPDELDRRRRSLQTRLHCIDALIDLVGPLVELSRKAANSTYELFEAARIFVEDHVRKIDELDNYAAMALREQIRSAAAWAQTEPIEHSRAWQWLEELASLVRVMGSGPRPGRLHAASATSGGHSGRPTIFLLGLDDGRFPGGGAQDALLLDDERRRLSPGLPTSEDQLARAIRSFDRLLARQQGRVVFSFSSHDVAGDRELFASPMLLDVYRLTSGDRQADQSALVRGLGSPASFAPTQPHASLSLAEWELCSLVAHPTSRTADALRPSYPHLADGLEAQLQRAGEAFTIFDGWVDEAADALDPAGPHGRISSAHSLETLGTCALRFFFRYGLGLEPPEAWDVDPMRWLDPLAKGSLSHEVFERFMRSLIAEKRRPEFARDETALLSLLQEAVEKYRAIIPPPSEAVFEREVVELRESMRIFLRDEEQTCRTYGLAPEFLEASIGLPSEEHGSRLDDEAPCEIRLAPGRTVRVRGRIDRIDRCEDEPTPTYVVWDYKTGSSTRYSQADPFRKGKVIQPLLYLKMAQQRLREVVDREARASRFGFFFPSLRARGERIVWRSDELEHGEKLLSSLASIARSGAFLATNDDQDCRYCDYRSICGDDAAKHAGRKLEEPTNAILQPIRELRVDGEKEELASD